MTADDIARRTAAQLADEIDPRLPASVEQQLQGGTSGQYFDPISLGALIVSVASLAWTIYHDHRNDGRKPSPEVLARQVRVQVELPEHASVEQRDRIIEVA